MLPKHIEGTTAIMAEKNAAVRTQLSSSPASASVDHRTGRFALQADGTLEGTIVETLTGHGAMDVKEWHWASSPAKIRDEMERRVTAWLKGAEVTGLEWENVTSLDFPVIVRCRVRVPGYAQAVGERLTFVPSVFTSGAAPVFTAETRATPILFPYACQEQDDIEIVLPEGFALEGGTRPSPINAEDDPLWAKYTIQFSKKTRTLGYARTMNCGFLPSPIDPRSYLPIKRRFDAIHAADGHTLILKPEAPKPEEGGS
jgi:hypothetical protein